MKKHWSYLKYVLRHKYFVLIECWKLYIPWRGLVHDLSKFRPDEWFPYVDNFYGNFPEEPYIKIDMGMTRIRVRCKKDVQEGFDKAWLFHQHKNPHHWQYWLLKEDDGDKKLIQMPEKLALEMVADWVGAGKAQGHNQPGEVLEWYNKNKERILLHPDTQKFVEELLNIYYSK